MKRNIIRWVDFINILKLKNPWMKVIENIELKEADYKGTKDIFRMREIIITRKNDYDKGANELEFK